ncbi:MAG: alpha/beta hydrolase, partial [Propionibacteriaceae bacterium]|nr:alpha/beta hydrolase [Propionibacteriaceae bacterium]
RRLTDEEWRGLVMPLRIDIAGAQSPAGGEKAVARVRTLRPDATVTLWPTATHSLPMQESATIGPALLEFWRTHS